MLDPMDIQGVLFGIKGKQDAVVSTARSAHAQQFVRQRFAEPMGIVGESPGNELDDGLGRLFRQSPKPLKGGAGDFDLLRSLAS